MKKIIVGLLSLIGLNRAAAQQTNLSKDMQELKFLNATFINNFVTNDTVSHSKIIHNDFVCITSTGQ